LRILTLTDTCVCNKLEKSDQLVVEYFMIIKYFTAVN